MESDMFYPNNSSSLSTVKPCKPFYYTFVIDAMLFEYD